MSAPQLSAPRAVRLLTTTFVVLCVLLALLFAGVVWALLLRPETRVTADTPVTVNIERGATTAVIAAQLADAGVVPNRYMFRLRARLAGADASFVPGAHELATGMGYAAVIDALRRETPSGTVTVTIPEGFVLEQVAERLEAQAGIPADEFLALAKGGADEFVARHPHLADAHEGSLEGYLFPKTYRLREGADAREVIEVMLGQFERELEAVDIESARREGFSVHDIVTIASIVEREARLERERPLVSSVIRNRLARAMRLEIDATVEYVLPGNRFRLRYRDLEVDSPFNTYRNAGLPPGPISNPGLSSLRAAVDPADTKYLYYVLTDTDGSHTFTTNKRDFLKAKAKSKEVFGR